MTKKSKEQILREIETAIQRLDKEGLPDSEIIDILAAKGVPANRAEALLIKRRAERRNSLLGSGVGALLFGCALMVIVVMAWTGALDVSIMRQSVVGLMGGATAVLMLLIGVIMIIQSLTTRIRR